MKLAKILAPTDLAKLLLRSGYGAREGAEVIVYHVISEDGDCFDKDDALNPARP